MKEVAHNDKMVLGDRSVSYLRSLTFIHEQDMHGQQLRHLLLGVSGTAPGPLTC